MMTQTGVTRESKSSCNNLQLVTNGIPFIVKETEFVDLHKSKIKNIFFYGKLPYRKQWLKYWKKLENLGKLFVTFNFVLPMNMAVNPLSQHFSKWNEPLVYVSRTIESIQELVKNAHSWAQAQTNRIRN